MQENPRPLILLIENDESDVFLFRRALNQIRFKGDVRVVGSATEATTYMEQASNFRDTDYFRVPYLIVSDFKLIGHTALDFVRWLRSQTQFAEIPVVILSGVVTDKDAVAFSPFHVTAFIRKTADIMALGALLQPLLPAVRQES